MDGPTGVSAARTIAQAQEPGLIAIGAFGLGDGQPKGCRSKRRCCRQIDQASRSRYCERLMKISPVNGLRRYGMDAKHRFPGRHRLGREGSRPWITAAANRIIWESLGYRAIPCAVSRCIASNRTPCRGAPGTSSATVTRCLRSFGTRPVASARLDLRCTAAPIDQTCGGIGGSARQALFLRACRYGAIPIR